MAESEILMESSPADGVEPHLRSSLLSNSVFMGAANLFGRGLGYGYIILMARRLDAKYLGAYAILTTTSMLVDLVSNFGLDKVVIREVASAPASIGRGYFQAALPIRLSVATIAAIAVWVLLTVSFRGLLLSTPFSVAVFLSAIFPLVATRNCEAFLTAKETLLPVAVAQLSEKAVISAAVVLLVTGVFSFDVLLFFTPLATFIRLLVTSLATRRIWGGKMQVQRPHMKRLIKHGLELFSVEILALVYFRSDVFFVAKMGGLRETAVYQIAYKIFDFCLSLFTGFLQAAFPRLVREKSRKSLKAMLAGGAALLSIPVATIVLSRHLILAALGPEYVNGSTSLVWLMLTVPLVYVTSTLANAAIAAGQVRILIAIAFLLIITNVGLNIILIPKWSINGAAFSTFACELLSAAILGPFIFRALPGRADLRTAE